jgi:hypothetical protein
MARPFLGSGRPREHEEGGGGQDGERGGVGHPGKDATAGSSRKTPAGSLYRARRRTSIVSPMVMASMSSAPCNGPE